MVTVIRSTWIAISQRVQDTLGMPCYLSPTQILGYVALIFRKKKMEGQTAFALISVIISVLVVVWYLGHDSFWKQKKDLHDLLFLDFSDLFFTFISA
jgi:hypothetical protein